MTTNTRTDFDNSEPVEPDPVAKLLKAALGPYQGPVPYCQGDFDGEPREAPASWLQKNEHADLHLLPSYRRTTFFIAWNTSCSPDDLIANASLLPSAILENDGHCICVVRLEKPVPTDNYSLGAAEEMFGLRIRPSVPLPGTDGYQLIYDNDSVAHSFDYLLKARRLEEPKKAKPSSKSSGSTLSKKSSGTPPDEPSDATPFGLARAAINNLPKSPHPDQSKAIFKLLAAITDEIELKSLKSDLKPKLGTGYTLKDIDKAIEDAKEKPASSPSQAPDGYEFDSEGRLILNHFGGVDSLFAITALRCQLVNWNDAAPKFGRKDRSPRFSYCLDQVYKLRSENGRARFVPLTEGALNSTVPQIMFTRKHDLQKGAGPLKHVHKDITGSVYQDAYEFLPTTPEIINTPIVGPDGRFIETPGWDTLSNVFLDPGDLQLPPFPVFPSDKDMETAKARLNELLGEFRFCDERSDGGDDVKEASRANAIGMLLTPFMRRYIKGCTPLFLVDKPQAKCGATLLCILVMMIFAGRISGGTPYTEDEAEFQKVLVAAIRDGNFFILIDNCTSLENRILKSALTSEEIAGRILGVSTMVRVLNKFIWMATGINPHIDEEMARRIVYIRFEPQTDPNHKYSKNLTKWVPAHRAELVWSLLVLIRNWFATGEVRAKDKTLDSYEDFAEVIGGILAAAGIKGFLTNPRAASVGTHDDDVKEFAEVFYGVYGLTPQSFKTIKNWALDCGFAVLGAGHEDTKIDKLRKALNTLRDRPFPFGTGVKFKIVEKDGEVTKYGFVERKDS